MPFLRVLRDKRGYETTYLMHWYRDGGRQRSRILYVFRTPPGVRVGRAAFDPAVVREIESQHPDIEFDWRALVDNQQLVEMSPEPRRSRGAKAPARSERDARRKRREKEETSAPKAEAGVEAPAAPPRPPVPAAIEGATRDEQLAFLTAWYPQLRDRIPHRTQDPIRREALLALVERLNPAPWTDEEQIARGLQDAAESLQRLSRVFSKRRRRSRRPRPSEPSAPSESGA